jgi:ubiquinone/menaquinone biosynthesis C-methylase UbiE
MGLYARYILPKLIDVACGAGGFRWQRKQIMPWVRGEVLEVGIGSALNAPHYPDGLVRVTGLEPDAGMLSLAEERLEECRVPVDIVQGSAEMIPLPDASVDSVLMTFSLCTIPDPIQALSEMRRVLRPEGRLVFAEHGVAPDPGVARLQGLLNGSWQVVGGGCHLTRDPVSLLERAGFQPCAVDSSYARKTPRPFGYISRGFAEKD